MKRAGNEPNGPGKGEEKDAGNGPVNSPGKGPVKKTLQGPLQVLKWIILLFVPVNLLVIAISFAFPGKLGCIDQYQVAVQKGIIHQMDRARSRHIFGRKHPDTYSANAIRYAELTPYLDELQPGTLFFSVQGRSVSKIFIRNEWKHGGIFLGTLRQIGQYWGENHALVAFLRTFYTEGDEYLIFDSSYDQGVAIHSIRDMAGLNAIPTLRKLLFFEFTCNKDVWAQALQSNLSYLGKPYDYCFVLDNEDALYCSEFLREVLPVGDDYFQPSAKIAGRPLLLPSDLVDAFLDKGTSSGLFRQVGCILKNEGVLEMQQIQQCAFATLNQCASVTRDQHAP